MVASLIDKAGTKAQKEKFLTSLTSCEVQQSLYLPIVVAFNFKEVKFHYHQFFILFPFYSHILFILVD